MKTDDPSATVAAHGNSVDKPSMSGPSARGILAWFAALIAVLSLYGHTLVGIGADRVTPVLAVCLAATLSLMSLLWVASPRIGAPATALRKYSAFALFISVSAFSTFGLLGFLYSAHTLNDLGLLLLQITMPILLLFNNDRITLLGATGTFCAVFATLDAGANMGAALGLWHLADAGGRYDEYGQRIIRFGGLTGNSLASGLVALVAVGVIASRLRNCHQWRCYSITMAWLVAIAISLELTDARRYLAGVTAMVVLIVFPWGRWLPLPLVTLALAAGGLLLTFHATDSENVQRAGLMSEGWRDAASHVLLGEGVKYRVAPSGSDFNSLWAAHSTESGVIDLAIANGWLATGIFLLAALLALAAKRKQLTWPPVLLAIMTGEIAYTNPLNGFLGTVLYFGCIIYVISDEAPAVS